MDRPRITIVMPVYNAEAYLRVALESVLDQTESSLELIAVDDGSTDGSALILQEYAERDVRIKVIRQKNMGGSGGRNKGIENATGEWLAFMDADDYLLPDCLETWLRRAEADDLQMVIGNGFTFPNDPQAVPKLNPKKVLLHHQPGQRVMTGSEWIERCVEAGEWPHYVWLQMVRLDVIEKLRLRFLSGRTHEDILWTARVALGVERVGCCAEPLCGYRQNPHSVSRNPSEEASVLRAESYLLVFRELTAIGAASESTLLRHALFRQVNREAGHFLGLIRKRIFTPQVRARLAGEFLRDGTIAVMLKGARNGNEIWRAIRCWLIFRRVCFRLNAFSGKAG